MSPEFQSFTFEQTIKVSPAQVFYAFTNATALKEWMCDVATLNPKAGGRIYVAWNSGYYASGEYTTFEPDHNLAFTWYGRNDPAATLVEVTLTPAGESTRVRLVHSGLGSGESWADATEGVTEGWSQGLENLASVLESGVDLRIVNRPMLGITVGEFNEQQAKALGVPVSQGIRLDGVLETMGAYAAGLRKDDVIVALASKEITDWPSLSNALNHRRAGDQVEVVFYRGPERKTTLMTLSKRPIPEMPTTVETLAEMAKKRFAAIDQQLDELLAGVSEAEASHKPASDAWSVKEILTHLIHGERDGQNYFTGLLGGQQSWSDDYAGNLDSRTNATLAAFPTLYDLHQELKRLYIESAALYANIPSEFAQNRKGTFWGMAYFMAEPPYHDMGHFDQMREALQSARK